MDASKRSSPDAQDRDPAIDLLEKTRTEGRITAEAEEYTASAAQVRIARMRTRC